MNLIYFLFSSVLDVPAGERGELWLKGPNIMKVNNLMRGFMQYID